MTGTPWKSGIVRNSVIFGIAWPMVILIPFACSALRGLNALSLERIGSLSKGSSLHTSRPGALSGLSAIPDNQGVISK